MVSHLVLWLEFELYYYVRGERLDIGYWAQGKAIDITHKARFDVFMAWGQGQRGTIGSNYNQRWLTLRPVHSKVTKYLYFLYSHNCFSARCLNQNHTLNQFGWLTSINNNQWYLRRLWYPLIYTAHVIQMQLLGPPPCYVNRSESKYDYAVFYTIERSTIYF